MTEEKRACPDCDTLDVTRRVRTGEWACKQCGWKGHRTAWREPMHTGQRRNGLAGVLEDLDPDEVGGEG